MTPAEPASPSALARFLDNPYAGFAAEAARLPLADEPCLEAWRDYAREAADDGAAAVLRRRLVQLRFPIRAGISGEAAYQGAVRRGEPPPAEGGAELVDPDGIALAIHPTPAGAVPVVTARHRADFETLVRALASRNEPRPVPPAMGACLVRGLVNPDRLERRRLAFLAAGHPPAGWPAERARRVADRGEYQDTVLLLSTGPYSAVDAAELGLEPAGWRAISGLLRRDHEAFHYLTFRLSGRVRSHLLDEVLADLAGLLATPLPYRAATALRFLGIDEQGALRQGARLHLYVGEPPLAGEDLATAVELTVAATRNLEAALATEPRLADPAERTALLLRAASLGLAGLAEAGTVARLSTGR